MSIPKNRDTAELFEEIKKISEKAVTILRNEYPEDDILSLTKKDLKKLFPGNGIRRYNKRKGIMRLIDQFKQAESVGDNSEASVSGQHQSSEPKKPVKVNVLVAGETFGTHDTFIKKLKLKLKKVDTQESSSVILVFCPVVSRIGTDMEAAMARVTVNKPVILVFMHHCHSPSHMTNITVQPSRSNIVQVVHCAIHETRGLLKCQENEQAVKAVRSALLRYDDSHGEFPQSKVPRTQLVTVQQQMAIQGDNRAKNTDDNEIPGMDTDPVREESKSFLKRIVPAKGRSTGPSGESVKVHMLVAGETFQAHETFMQKLKLQIELCSAESSNVILVFCPVVSRIGTDMEAAMARVTEDIPVILVFMHHCHHPSHMTNITVQPSRSKIEKAIHCAFHETEGLLQCKENNQAVKEVRSELKKYKNKKMKKQTRRKANMTK